MAANTGERTLIPALVPPGAAHVNAVFTASVNDHRVLARLAGFSSSLLLDATIRAVPKGDIYFASFLRLPFVSDHALSHELMLRVLRCNAITDAYADLWSAGFDRSFTADRWTGNTPLVQVPLHEVSGSWAAQTPLRVAADRRQAQVEIDALVALMLGVTADELCTIYRTQFAVLYGYDHNVYFYDANGRLVPNSVLTVWRKKGERITEEERTATNQAGNTYTYELPFVTLDREADMRQAYAEFERRLAERS